MTGPDLTGPDLTSSDLTSSGLAKLADALACGDEPGLAIGVYARGKLAASATAGCGLPEHGVPVTETTAFDIASVSKHMTSACLLLLARDGLVDLDADIRSSLPELRLTRPVTLRQCLTHTAGLRDYFALCDIAGIGVLGITQDRFMDLAAGQEDLDFAPGSEFSYSNTGYALAATLVSRVTGAGLARLAAERVFGPLGMTATHFRDDVSLLVPGLAGGYIATGTGGTRFRRYDVTEEVVGDGAVVTTLTDLAAWHAFMADGAVLGTDIRDGLLVSQVLTDGTDTGYGLGLQLIDVAGQPGLVAFGVLGRLPGGGHLPARAGIRRQRAGQQERPLRLLRRARRGHDAGRRWRSGVRLPGAGRPARARRAGPRAGTRDLRPLA